VYQDVIGAHLIHRPQSGQALTKQQHPNGIGGVQRRF
jgi:hypothetical protein